MAGERSQVSSGAPDGVAGLAGAPPREEVVRAALVDSGPAVRRYLFGMCGDWDQAEDLAQEALLRAWKGRQGFDGRSEPRTWIFAIARNQWLDSLRREKTRPPTEPMNEATYIPHNSPAPDAAARRGELARAVNAALGELPAEQREALALRESEGLSFAQVAALLGVPVPTAKSRVRYALLKLAERLAPLRSELES